MKELTSDFRFWSIQRFITHRGLCDRGLCNRVRDGTGTGYRPVRSGPSLDFRPARLLQLKLCFFHVKIYKTSAISQEYLSDNIYRRLLFQVSYIIYHYLETKAVVEQVTLVYRLAQLFLVEQLFLDLKQIM